MTDPNACKIKTKSTSLEHMRFRSCKN